MDIDFELFGEITDAETIAIGPSIRELRELRARFGHGRWRKRKGVANVRLRGGRYDWPNCIGMKLTGLVK